MTRTKFNWILGSISVLVALYTLFLAVNSLSTLPFINRKTTGYILLAFWGLAPPAFFWIDWVVFCRNLTKDELDVAKHTHDLSRNIWLALLAFLAITFNVKP